MVIQETDKNTTGEWKATNNRSHFVEAAETQVPTPTPPDATTDGATFVAPAINPDTISVLSDDDLIAACKSQFKLTDSSYSLFRRDKHLLASIYDEMVSRFRDEHSKGHERDGKPTLRQAFALAGWNYDAARRFRQRHEQEKKSRMLTTYENPARPLKLTEGDTVELKDDKAATEYVVVNVHESAPKVDIAPKSNANGRTETVPTESLKKASVPVKKVKRGDLLLCEDIGAEYIYKGNGEFARTKTPTVLQQKRERELANIEAKQRREKAKSEEKKSQREVRKAEAVRRELDKLAERERRKADAEAKKQAARNKKVESAAKKTPRTKEETAAKPTDPEKVKVARIGDTNEFGVFPESETEYTIAKALTIGTKQVCETERERINANRARTAGSRGNVVGMVNAEAQQEA
jgi:hypothetical protein